MIENVVIDDLDDQFLHEDCRDERIAGVGLRRLAGLVARINFRVDGGAVSVVAKEHVSNTRWKGRRSEMFGFEMVLEALPSKCWIFISALFRYIVCIRP